MDAQTPAKENFFERPDVVDLVVRRGDLLLSQLEERPYIKAGKMLSNGSAIIYMPQDMIEQTFSEIGTGDLAAYPILMGLMARSDLAISGITEIQESALDLRGQGVLLGFVDTGIDYTSAAFLYEDNTTKIKYIWDQSISGKPPDTFPFGSEYNEAQINEALRSRDPYKIVPQRDTVGHGTFLASVGGSREPGEHLGAAPDSEIIAVKLRKASAHHLERELVPPEQENAFSSADLMLGVQYILEKASELRMPVSICIGLGSNDGGHDGFLVLEEFLTSSSNRTGVSICVAAGNETLARHHAQGRLQGSGSTQDIEIMSEGNIRGFFLQIWNGASDRLSVSVTSPAGEIVGRVPARPGNNVSTTLLLEKSRVEVEYYFPNPRSGSQVTFVKIITPSPGIWKITVYGDIIVDGSFHVWLPVTGLVYPGVEFLTPSPNYTITVPGTSVGMITVGAYRTQTRSLYSNSSWGPSRLPALLPDLCAPGVEVGGIFPFGYGSMTGTSVAAAITAGACALMLQWGIVEGNEVAMNTYLIKSYLIRGCERDPGIIYPNEQWGYGRLNLYNSFAQLGETR